MRRRLLENGKIARATHNVAAWRVWDEDRGVQLHDNDDDGTLRSLGYYFVALPLYLYLNCFRDTQRQMDWEPLAGQNARTCLLFPSRSLSLAAKAGANSP